LYRLTAIVERVKRSKHAFIGFVLTIVGQRALPAGLGVSVYNDSIGTRLAYETTG
jgi:hypothetical protein